MLCSYCAMVILSACSPASLPEVPSDLPAAQLAQSTQAAYTSTPNTGQSNDTSAQPLETQPDEAQSILTTDLPTQIPATSSPEPRTPPPPDAWMDLPVIPSVSETARQVYQRGLSTGRNPHAFSKVGDCQSITTYFLALFDKPGLYQLGQQGHLQETIDWFSGSFQRESLAVKGGLNAAAMLSSLRADPQLCQVGETPLACELRLHNPSLALISLEEWWADDPTKYERYMRQIIEYTLSQDILPILATKADNLEGDHRINQTIAQLAWEYDLPLWNFWLAVQPLPNQGLVQKTADGQPDLFHLTHSTNYYDYRDVEALTSGWAMRNLTALQALHRIQRLLNNLPLP